MSTAARATLLHAADLIEADARSLRECGNVDPQRPDWKDEPDARAAHDDALCTALELRLLAKRINDGQVAVSPARPAGLSPSLESALGVPTFTKGAKNERN